MTDHQSSESLASQPLLSEGVPRPEASSHPTLLAAEEAKQNQISMDTTLIGG